MKELPRGHVVYRGKEYVRPYHAGKLIGVHTMTVTRWFELGKIKGTMLPTKNGNKNTPYILKSALTTSLYEFICAECHKKTLAKSVITGKKRRFCSRKCRTKWWNRNAPPIRGVRRKKKNIA